jgi:hypothetical protein
MTTAYATDPAFIQALHEMRRIANIIDASQRSIAYVRALAEEGEAIKDAPLVVVFEVEGLYEKIDEIREATRMLISNVLASYHRRHTSEAIERAYASPYGRYVSEYMYGRSEYTEVTK